MSYQAPNLDALRRGREKLLKDHGQLYRKERLKAIEAELRAHGALVDEPHEDLHREKEQIRGQVHRLKKRIRQLERRHRERTTVNREAGKRIFKHLFGA